MQNRQKYNKVNNRKNNRNSNQQQQPLNFDLPRPVSIRLKSLLQCNAHFGHKKGHWNPKVKKYLYGITNGTHVIDIKKTEDMWPEIQKAIFDTVVAGKKILFVGTKYKASEIIKEEASLCDQPYVNIKWLPGTLTNFKTVEQTLFRFVKLENMLEDQNVMSNYSKKEILKLSKERDKLEKFIGGVKDLRGMPGMIFVVDINKEHIAISEAKKLNIPIVALVDSNADPTEIDYPIPCNDDAVKAIKLFTAAVADTVLEAKAAKAIYTDKEETTEEEEEIIVDTP